jgi:hypothetical protein
MYLNRKHKVSVSLLHMLCGFVFSTCVCQQTIFVYSKVDEKLPLEKTFYVILLHFKNSNIKCSNIKCFKIAFVLHVCFPHFRFFGWGLIDP